MDLKDHHQLEQLLDHSYRTRTATREKLIPIAEKYGIKKTELSLMLLLHMNSKLKTAKEVEEFSELKRGIISITVESLCNSEYLTQITSEEDRRMKYLKLTEKAEPILKDCDEIISSYIEKLMDGISKEEMEICQRVFMKMNENSLKMNGGKNEN